MIQKCSLLLVLEVFFKEPTKIHFIREISREINLAHTSVRNHINYLKKEKLILKKESKPFDGFVANRENEKFLYYKKTYNFYSLFELKKIITQELSPKGIFIFGSYSRGEDIEDSDIDVAIVSKVVASFKLDKLETKLKRKINIMNVKDLKEFDEDIMNSIFNGWII